MLQNGRNLYLTQINKQLVKLFLALTSNDEVGTEWENTSSENRQNFKSLKAQNAIENEEDLIDFKHIDESVVHPVEGNLQWVDTESVQVVAHFRFVCLQ